MPESIALNVPGDVIAVVDCYARLNGRTWRSKLRALWESGRDDSSLRQARNMIGPRGLDSFVPGRMVSTLPPKAMSEWPVALCVDCGARIDRVSPGVVFLSCEVCCDAA